MGILIFTVCSKLQKTLKGGLQDSTELKTRVIYRVYLGWTLMLALAVNKCSSLGTFTIGPLTGSTGMMWIP